ncbi:MAG TPA: DUF4202 domain-containing protein [Gammaproteobacteria bacterium]|jgi:hypothetical protein|nr:DUF4202 domain-containing protein [Gammaproteobacteria bacterium]
MSEQHSLFETALAQIDAANSEDPNKVTVDGQEWPKELLYSTRMSDMLGRFAPDADDAVKLAIRAQHIQRWKSPRSDYPMDRIGYLQWRKDLYKIQAQTAVDLLKKVGYGDDVTGRVFDAVAKKRIKENPDTQLLEDVTDLVFIEHYMLEFAGKHPEYTEEKWLDIIRKTWNKMSEQAQQFALAGNITLPEPLVPLIQKAVAGD